MYSVSESVETAFATGIFSFLYLTHFTATQIPLTSAPPVDDFKARLYRSPGWRWRCTPAASFDSRRHAPTPFTIPIRIRIRRFWDLFRELPSVYAGVVSRELVIVDWCPPPVFFFRLLLIYWKHTGYFFNIHDTHDVASCPNWLRTGFPGKVRVLKCLSSCERTPVGEGLGTMSSVVAVHSGPIPPTTHFTSRICLSSPCTSSLVWWAVFVHQPTL